MVNYIEGDLFAAIKDKKETIILPHVCNDKNVFGAGFVVPLKKHFPEAEVQYLQMSLVLGKVGFVKVGNVLICNMIAQTLGGKRPLFYNHLAACMDQVAKVITKYHARGETCEIHGPAFGSNLAGGSYKVIAPLIEDCWVRSFNSPPAINIYYLPGTFLPPS